MKMIKQLINEDIQETTGAYRIRNLKRKQGKDDQWYHAFELEDATGSLQGFAKIKEGLTKDALLDNKRMVCRIKTHQRQDEVYIEVLSAAAWVAGMSSPIDLLPVSQCPCLDALQALMDFRNALTNSHLKHFVDRVFSNDELALLFIASPASLNHHHNLPGGLLIHSLETAEMVGRMGAEQPDRVELGQVAALFHDIGKVRTMTKTMKRTSMGFVIDHDALTLEILAPALSMLERRWSDGATALRYLWTWNHQPKPGTPMMVMAEVLRAADRISSGIDVEQQAYDGAPHWKQGAQLPTQPYPQRFWRPRQQAMLAIRP